MLLRKLYTITSQILVGIGLVGSLGAAPKEEPNSTQIAELRLKISDYEDKSAKVVEKIAATKSETAADQQSTVKYRETFAMELARLQKEKNELSSDKIKLTQSADSLSRAISGIQNGIRELELRQESFRTSVVETIDLYAVAVNEFPSPLLLKEKESLTFLRRELSSSAISAVEGIERLWQILQSINKERLTVDVWQAVSVWGKITGQVHYLRIGYAWLGMVNENGTTGAVWNGSQWSALTDPVQIQSLRTAVKVRTGNAVPVIVQIPLVKIGKVSR